jgi:(p)ppGpp synthase/HD superfamily hydrolase
MIERARKFAEEAHRGQTRKYNGTPYFMHPERVAKRLEVLGFWPEMIAAGYLHDVVEDCGVKIEEIRSIFGDKVADLVFGLTNPSKGMKAPRAERKRVDREHLSSQPKNVKIIKLVDRIDNIREMDGSDSDFKKLYAKETLLLIPCLYSDNGIDDPVYYGLMSELSKLANEMA